MKHGKTLWRLRSFRRRAGPTRTQRLAIEARLRSANALPACAGTRLAARMPAFVLASLVLLLTGGTVAYAYGSPAVVEGHPLYGLKRGTERAQERLAEVSPETAIQFRARMAERRLREAERLQTRDAPRARVHLERAAADLDGPARQRLEEVRDEERREKLGQRMDRVREEIQVRLRPQEPSSDVEEPLDAEEETREPETEDEDRLDQLQPQDQESTEEDDEEGDEEESDDERDDD